MAIGDSRIRVDAYVKVTGEAKYMADLEPKHAYVAKIVRSTIANGVVTGFDLKAARVVTGVVAIYTCFDAPGHSFPTPGHPWSVEPAHQDVADRRILNTRVCVHGDEIAVVVAENEMDATRAARLVRATYEEYRRCARRRRPRCTPMCAKQMCLHTRRFGWATCPMRIRKRCPA